MKSQLFTLIFRFQVINKPKMGSCRNQMRMSNVYGRNMIGQSRSDLMSWIVANYTVIEMLGTDRQDNINYELSADYPYAPIILEEKDRVRWAEIWVKHSVSVGLETIRIWRDYINGNDQSFLDLMRQA